MSTVVCSASSQDIPASERVILAFTRNYKCWQCEQPLLPGFCGVRAALPSYVHLKYPLLFLTCNQMCQKRVALEWREKGLSAWMWDGPRVRRFFDNPENIAGTLQDINLNQMLKANRS